MAGFNYKRAKNMGDIQGESVQTQDPFDDYCIGKELKFAWLPKKCYFTGKMIWLKKAIRRTAMYSKQTNPYFVHRWYDKNEYIVWRLSI